ncbi:MAG TPA: hypothetical protein VMW50_01290 [Dehalococcoidia bacterium]|nr:hypothetical protein [Dehalococcoidia bacterium]
MLLKHAKYIVQEPRYVEACKVIAEAEAEAKVEAEAEAEAKE